MEKPMYRKRNNFLQKLYSREIYATFERERPVIHDKAIKLFKSIPDRLMFYLENVIPHMGNHILVGTTRCGQFLITYSYATDLRLPVQMLYKYRLHWWAFRPGASAYKVAEVQLFDNQDITYALTVGIAQWPNVNDKLIAYGYSEDDTLYDQDEGGLECRKYYITVTTLPSLDNCKDCKAVADSFDEEEMAANWDSCIGLSCLKHGLTIHTTLDVAPPYPSFDFLTNLKIDNKIIVNTGNFLHVLSFTSDKKEIKPSKDDNIVPGEICHKVGEMLSNCLEGFKCPWKTGSGSCLNSRQAVARSMNKAWLNTIMDKAEKVYAFEESDDGCEPRFKWFKKRRLADKMYEFNSDDEDMENKCPPSKVPRTSPPRLEQHSFIDESFVEMDALNEDNSEEGFKSPSRVRNDLERVESLMLSDERKFFRSNIKSKRSEIESRRRRDNSEKISNTSVSVSVVTESTAQINKRLEEAGSSSGEIHQNMAVPQQTVGYQSVCDNFNALVSYDSTPSLVSSTSDIEVVPSRSDSHKITPLDMSIINPDLSSILAEWEAESVSSLSPRSDSFFNKNSETKNDVIQSFLERIPGMTISPRSSNCGLRNSDNSWIETAENGISRVMDGSHLNNKVSSPNSPSINKYSPMLVVLRTRNCNQDKELQKLKDQDDKCKIVSKEEVITRVKSVKEADNSMRQRMISGCSVRFDRIYIEVDEEIISTITDIEDDDQGTGFHCALPLSVHGTAYAQLQMVSSQKAERMSIHCERVDQTSLDIEQFCFKAADIICQYEGFKFWFCNDYDVEIIDVCAFNGDILGVVCMRVNAEKKPPKNEKYNIVNQRYFYDINCVFIWNLGTERCWLEAYSPLIDVTKQMNSHWGSPARREATKLQSALKTSSLFTLAPHPPIRTFEHRMWSNDVLSRMLPYRRYRGNRQRFFTVVKCKCPSMEEIRDHTNLIGFRLSRSHRSPLRIVEFWG